MSPYLVSKQQPFTTSGAAIMVISLATALASSMLPETKGKHMGLHAKDLGKEVQVKVVRLAHYTAV
jgi:hypothetical protein